MTSWTSTVGDFLSTWYVFEAPVCCAFEGTNCFSDIDKWPVSLDWRHVNLSGAKTINWNWNLRNHKSGEEKPRGQCCLSSFSNLATIYYYTMNVVASLLRFSIAMLSQTCDYFLLSDATYDFDSYNDIHWPYYNIFWGLFINSALVKYVFMRAQINLWRGIRC